MLGRKNTGYYHKRIKVKETRSDIDNGKITNYAPESPMKIESRPESVRTASIATKSTATKPKAKAEQAASTQASTTSVKHVANTKTATSTSATKEKHSENAADVMKQAHEQAAKNPVEQQLKRIQSVNVTA